MSIYYVTAPVTISVTVAVEADNPEQAKERAEDSPMGDIADCLNAMNSSHWGDETLDVWLAEELDGTPDMSQADVREK